MTHHPPLILVLLLESFSVHHAIRMVPQDDLYINLGKGNMTPTSDFGNVRGWMSWWCLGAIILGNELHLPILHCNYVTHSWKQNFSGNKIPFLPPDPFGALFKDRD